MQANSQRHSYVPVSSDALNLETVERKGKKLQKIEYLENKKR